MCFSALISRGRLANLGERDVLLIVGTKNTEFTGHRTFGGTRKIRKKLNKAN